MSHICANDEYRSQVGAANRSENIVIRYVSFVSLKVVDIFSFHLQIFHWFIAPLPRSQPMRESNTSFTIPHGHFQIRQLFGMSS
jgi:hypothetical protein